MHAIRPSQVVEVLRPRNPFRDLKPAPNHRPKKEPLMKIKLSSGLIVALFILAGTLRAAPLTTAFTYQGRLLDKGELATGLYDLRFALYPGSSGGSQIGSALTNASVGVSNGLFTATLDFGGGIFDGTAYWLEIGVRTNGSLAAFTPLVPRQPLTASPYALYAPKSGLAGGVAANAVAGASIQNGAITAAKIASGQVVKSLNSLKDDVVLGVQAPLMLGMNGNTLQLSLSGGAGWNLSGNSGTSSNNFLGTIDNQPLEVRVNSARALRLEPTSDTPNVIGGFSGNYAQPGLPGVTIGGGGTAINNQPNNVTSNGYYGTIAGGYDNTVGGYGAFIGGGSVNVASGDFATIAAGQFNTASYPDTTVSGGQSNRATYYFATVGGGVDNVASGSFSMVAGGGHNTASGTGAFVGGGGGDNGLDLSFPNRADGEWSVIGGGIYNTVQGATFASTIGGGGHNTIELDAQNATISGGAYNTTGGNYATVGGGYQNTSMGASATVGGGYQNTSSGYWATVPGGRLNVAAGDFSFAAGHNAKANHRGAFVWADSTGSEIASTADNHFLVYASGGVGIGVANPTTALDVAGSVHASGLIRNGSEAGTSEAPSPTGLVVRRINSTSSSAGQVVARTDLLTLERDGTAGGMLVVNHGSPGIKETVNFLGIDSSGTPKGRTFSFDNFKIGDYLEIFYDTQNIVHAEISFGRTFDAGQHMTQVVIDRYDDGVTHDFYWSGTVTSTFNQ